MTIVLFSLSSWAHSVYFSPEDHLDSVVIEEISKARKSIDIAIYTFRSAAVRDALSQVMSDNPELKVRLLVRRSGVSALTRLLDPLMVHWASSEETHSVRYVTLTNHHKFMVVDGESLVTTSANFNSSSLAQTYDENTFVCSAGCRQMVSAYAQEFDFLFKNANDFFTLEAVNESPFVRARSIASHRAWFTSFNMEPKVRGVKASFFRKDQEPYVKTRLVKAMDEAQESIVVATGHLRSWPLAKALKRAHERGVQVKILLDSQEYITPQEQAAEDLKKQDCENEGVSLEDCVRKGFHFGRWLASQGLDVSFKYYMLQWSFIFAPQMHHKYMVVDGDKVYSGSYNWSDNAEWSSFENIAVHDRQSVVQKYEQNFEAMMQYGVESSFQNWFATWKESGSELQLKFDAKIMKLEEIDQIWTTVCDLCGGSLCEGLTQVRESTLSCKKL